MSSTWLPIRSAREAHPAVVASGTVTRHSYAGGLVAVGIDL